MDNTTVTPQIVNIKEIRIYTVSGSYDVTKLLVELSYYEDLYSFVISGYVLLRDARGIIEKFQLTGKETIKISFDNFIDRTFRLYSVPNRTPLGNLKSEDIKLHFCSEELLLSESTKITKSFKGKTISEMITTIMQNDLKAEKLNIQPSMGIYDFNIPTMRPFEAISWLSTYARPSMDKNTGADMVFYETKDGFNFSSLGTLYKREPYKTYKYDQKNVPSNAERKDTTVLDYQFVRAFDSLRDINSGTFANRLITLDPLNRTKIVTDFDYTSYNGSTLNSGDPAPNTKDRLGRKSSDAPLGVLKLSVSNANQKRKESFSDVAGSLAPDIFLETTVTNRTAQLSLANYTVIKIRVPGDAGLVAGCTINFNLMSLDADTSKQLDTYYSGRYIVTAVRHVVQSFGVFQTILELSRDSSPGTYSSEVPAI